MDLDGITVPDPMTLSAPVFDREVFAAELRASARKSAMDSIKRFVSLGLDVPLHINTAHLTIEDVHVICEKFKKYKIEHYDNKLTITCF